MTLLYTLRNSVNEQFVQVFESFTKWLNDNIGVIETARTTLDDFDFQEDYIDTWQACQDSLTAFKHETNAPGVGDHDLYDNIAFSNGEGWRFVYSVVSMSTHVGYMDEIILEVEDDNIALLFKLACL